MFARSLSIGAETMVMRFHPDAPMHERYRVEHDFLERRDGLGGGDDLAARQRVLPLGVQLVREPRPRRARSTRSTTRTPRPTSRSRACTTTSRGRSRRSSSGASSASSRGRRMAIDQDKRRYFEIGDRDDLATRRSCASTAGSPTSTSRSRRTSEFCEQALPSMRELVVDYFGGPRLRPRCSSSRRARCSRAHEHEAMVARHRGLARQVDEGASRATPHLACRR